MIMKYLKFKRFTTETKITRPMITYKVSLLNLNIHGVNSDFVSLR